MTSKRPHTKSRRGCQQCKTRRVKCDEVAPCCGKCTRKGIVCDFQEYSAAVTRINLLTPNSFRAGGTETTTPDPQPSSDSSIPGPSFNLDDLGLLHYFTLHTSRTLPPIESDLYTHIWQHEVPRLAQSHAFLMHAVLGFAAAHQATTSGLDPNDSSPVRQHYGKALGLFRETFDAVGDAERSEALLCFTILTSFLTLLLECGTAAVDSDPPAGFASFLKVVQSSTRALAEVEVPLRMSTIGVLLSHTWGKQTHMNALQPEVERSLSTLERMFAEYRASAYDVNNTVVSLLTVAIQQLRMLFALADPVGKQWAYILAWPIHLPPGFDTLLRDHNPIALCALAHWCVPAYQAPAKWFTGDWPTRILIAVSDRLRDTPWVEGIEWPMHETIRKPKLASPPYIRW